MARSPSASHAFKKMHGGIERAEAERYVRIAELEESCSITPIMTVGEDGSGVAYSTRSGGRFHLVPALF